MEESKGGEEGRGRGAPPQQRGKRKRRAGDSGLGSRPQEEEEEHEASPASHTGARAGDDYASNAPPAGQIEHPLADSEIMTNLTGFIDDGSYLFTAVVCRCWNNAWQRQRLPKETFGVSAMTTPNQLRQSFTFGLEPSSEVCIAAARFGRLDLLMVARDAGCPWHVRVAVELARGGFTDAVKEACSGDTPCPMNEEVLDVAAEGSTWGLMRWLFGRGCRCSPRTMAAIAANAGKKGNVGPEALLQLANDRGAPWDVATSEELARRGLLETLIWAVDQGCPINERTTAAAAGGGHLDVLAWLRSQRCPWNVETCKQAALEGHLDVLQYAKTNNCPWNNLTCAMAALGGHMHILVWARQNRCYWKRSTCAKAAKGGHLGVLKWLRQHGCPWGTTTPYEAAKAGHLNILKWVRSAEAEADRCPWNSRVCQGCAEGGHLEILKWARSAGCPWDADVTKLATKNGHLDVLQYAIANGCPVKAGLKSDPAVNRHAHVRRWLRNVDVAQAEKANETEEGLVEESAVTFAAPEVAEAKSAATAHGGAQERDVGAEEDGEVSAAAVVLGRFC